MRSVFRASGVSLLLLGLLPLYGRAQGVVPGSIDISANGGITNLDGVDDKKGHGSFGFAVGYSAKNHATLSAEYNYLMLGSLTVNGETGKEHLQLYGVGVRVAIINTRLVVPYVLLGGGGSRLSATVTEGGVSASGSQNGGYFAAGGGVNLYAGQGFGIRPEFRYERQQFAATTVDGISISGGGQNDLRATVALFYQFGGKGALHPDYSSSKN